MTIYPHVDNPIVHDQCDCDKLRQMLEAVEPRLYAVYLFKNKVRIESLSSRTFVYPKTPSMEWIAGRANYMKKNNL